MAPARAAGCPARRSLTTGARPGVASNTSPVTPLEPLDTSPVTPLEPLDTSPVTPVGPIPECRAGARRPATPASNSGARRGCGGEGGVGKTGGGGSSAGGGGTRPPRSVRARSEMAYLSPAVLSVSCARAGGHGAEPRAAGSHAGGREAGAHWVGEALGERSLVLTRTLQRQILRVHLPRPARGVT